MKPSRAKIALVVAAVGVVLVAAAVAAAAAVTVVIAAAAVAAATAAIASQGGKHFSLSPRVSSVVTLNKSNHHRGTEGKEFQKQCDHRNNDCRAIKEFMTFSQLGLAPAQVRSCESLGYTEPTPIQKQAIPVVLRGED